MSCFLQKNVLATLVALVVSAASCSPEHATSPAGSAQENEACTDASDCAAGLICAGGYCVGVDSDAGVVDGTVQVGDAAIEDRAQGLDVDLTDLHNSPDATLEDALSIVPDAIADLDAALAGDANSLDSAVADNTSSDAALLADAGWPDSTGLDLDVANDSSIDPGCQLQLEPQALNLGEVVVGQSAEFIMTLEAQSGSCAVSGLSLDPPRSDVTLLSPQDWPQTLQAGETLGLHYVFAPTATGALDVVVQVQASLTTSARLQAQAIANDDVNCLHFVQTSLDFGQVPQDCPQALNLAVRNDCYLRRQVQSVQIDGADVFSNATSLPLDIAANQTGFLRIVLDAGSAGLQSARLSAVQGNGDNLGGGTVALLADVVSSASVTDIFVQGGLEPVDMVIVVDDSGSMQDAQEQLARDIATLSDAWLADGVDFHIGVTTTDMTDYVLVGGPQGKFIPLDEEHPVLTTQSNDLAQRLPDAILAGTDGSGTERGLDAAIAALSPELLADRNAGFLRPQAQLALLFVSDEDDQGTVPVQQIAEQLRVIKAALGANALSVGAIVGPGPNGCGDSSSGISAEAGRRYLQLVAALSGKAVSLCEPSWTDFLQSWADISAGQRAVFFARNDVQASPEVLVNGMAQVRNQDYSWDSARNAVVFRLGHIPLAGQEVELRYSPVCQ